MLIGKFDYLCFPEAGGDLFQKILSKYIYLNQMADVSTAAILQN